MNLRIHYKVLVISLILLMITLSVTIQNVEAQENSWISLPEMSFPRIGLSLAEVDNKIYALGGDGESPNEMFDPDINNWTVITRHPTVRWNEFSAATVCQNKIYLIGGGRASAETHDANEAYNPVNDSWEIKAPIPESRAGFSASTFNNKIYVFGGGWYVLNLDPNTGPLGYFTVSYNLTDVYDPNTNSWSLASPAPIQLYSCQSVVFEEKIYVFSKGIIQVYDPKTDSWLSEIRTNLNVSSNARMVATSGRFAPKRIHIVDFDKHHIYDPKSDSWIDGAPVLTFRSSFGLVVVNDKLYAIGGTPGNKKNEVYTPFSSYPDPTPTPTLSPTPTSSPEPTYSPTPTPEPAPFPTTLAVASIAIIAVTGIGILVYFKKYKKK